MKLVNISSKVISIGESLLMPDKEITVTKNIANAPAVKAFIKAGYLRLDNSDEQAEPKSSKAAKNAKKDGDSAEAKDDALNGDTEKKSAKDGE